MTKAIGRKINQYTKDGILLGTYDSSKEAERKTGVKSSNMRQCANKVTLTAGGFVWKYADKKEFKEATSV